MILWLLLFKDLKNGCWSFSGPFKDEREARRLLKLMSPKVEARVYPLDEIAATFGLIWNDEQIYSPSYLSSVMKKFE